MVVFEFINIGKTKQIPKLANLYAYMIYLQFKRVYRKNSKSTGVEWMYLPEKKALTRREHL